MYQDDNNREEWEEDEDLIENVPVIPKSNKGKYVKIAGIIGVTALLLFLLTRFIGGSSGTGDNPDQPDQPDINSGISTEIQTGTITITGEEDSADLQIQVDEAVEEGMFNVFVNTQIYLDNGKSDANLLIQNSKSNKRPVIVELYQKDTEEVIFRSDVIPAGSKLEKAKLSKTLAKGTYPCVAYFNVLDPETKEFINRIGVNVQVEVGA